MAEEKAKRIRRSGEELAAAFDAQIADLQKKIEDEENKQKKYIADSKEKIKGFRAKIKKLEAKKEAALNPKPRGKKKDEFKAIIEAAKKSGMSAAQMAEKLGFNLPE